MFKVALNVPSVTSVETQLNMSIRIAFARLNQAKLLVDQKKLAKASQILSSTLDV